MNGILRQLIILYILQHWQPGANFRILARNPAGCCLPFNSARIGIPPHIPNEQPDPATVLYGAKAQANSGRIVVATN